MAITETADGRNWYSGKDLDALLNRVEKPKETRRTGVLFPIKEDTIIDDIPVEPDPEVVAYFKSSVPSKKRLAKIQALRRVS